MPGSVALLRGINVGGKNTISMADLADCLRGAGFSGVRTYIQSGNVVFTTAADPQTEARIEEAIRARFALDVLTVVRTHADLAAVVAAAPTDHGAAHLRSDVAFLKDRDSVEAVLAALPELRPGVDAVAAGPGAIYFSRVAAHATRSRLSRIAAIPEYRTMTIRNWRTTTRLLELTAQG